MVQTPAKPITLTEFLDHPETKPASEYIEGRVIQKPMPQGKHSTLQTEFCSLVNFLLKPQRVARAYAELRCTFAGRSIVPDVAVFTWERIPRDANGDVVNAFMISPDWIVEILLPAQNQTKVTKNILHCLDYGTQMGWLIDPEERTIFVHLPNDKLRVFDQPEQQLPIPTFAQTLNLSVGQVFDWLKE